MRTLATLRGPLAITVHLAAEDPRYVDLRRNILSKLERALADVTVRLASSRQGMVGGAEDSYGVIEYAYGGRTATSRSTSHREVLPVLYELAGVSPPAPDAAADYPGYPLVARAELALTWFLGPLPLLIILAWWWANRPPRILQMIDLAIKNGGDA
jgi:hypothetical protein